MVLASILVREPRGKETKRKTAEHRGGTRVYRTPGNQGHHGPRTHLILQGTAPLLIDLSWRPVSPFWRMEILDQISSH